MRLCQAKVDNILDRKSQSFENLGHGHFDMQYEFRGNDWWHPENENTKTAINDSIIKGEFISKNQNRVEQ